MKVQKKYQEQHEYFLKHPYLIELVSRFILKKIIRICEDVVGFRIFIIDTQLCVVKEIWCGPL